MLDSELLELLLALYSLARDVILQFLSISANNSMSLSLLVDALYALFDGREVMGGHSSALSKGRMVQCTHFVLYKREEQHKQRCAVGHHKIQETPEGQTT